MGTVYRVGCRDCRVYRDIDKHMGNATNTPKDQTSAIVYMDDEISIHKYRYTLLVTFLLDHIEHNCVFFSEHDEEIQGALNEEEIDFWNNEGGV